ncbi:MAG: DUF4860 domain-containing protein [Oscillospiraceae bacterium]|nr:DUF4860 domain-containing protein [Oscillospiraceae bacterium]
MKNYKNKSLGDTISTIGSMLLFLLFTGSLLMMIAVAAGTYSRISTNFDKTFGSSASLRYISNKVKGAENVEIAENGTALFISTDGMIDIIYFRNGSLYENSVSDSAEPIAEGGTRLFDLNEMNVSEQGDLIKITVSKNNEQNSTYVRR